MARASSTAENNALAGVFAASAPTASATSTWASLHTGDPGTTGATEYSGVTRIQYSAGTPSAGTITNTATMTFTTSGSTAVTYCGIWTASTAGTYLLGAALASSVTAVTITFAASSMSYSAS